MLAFRIVEINPYLNYLFIIGTPERSDDLLEIIGERIDRAMGELYRDTGVAHRVLVTPGDPPPGESIGGIMKP